MIGDPGVQGWHRALAIGTIGMVSLAAWAVLWHNGAVLHGPVHHHDAGAGSPVAVLFVASWTMMTVAMMLPTTVPLVATFHTIAGRRPDRPLLMALIVLGYVLVWLIVGIVCYGLAALIQRNAATGAWLGTHARLADAAIFLTAGSYQFSPLKYRCLDKCRSPLSFVLGYWQGRDERRNAFRLGAHHGLFCVGCCWALMLLMFVAGVGSVAWMLLLGAIMATEKNASWGRRLSAPLGAALVTTGACMLAFS